jgi:hypothetical protein
MQCETCKREMTQLFLSVACDHCDYGVPKERLHVGFVLHCAASPNAEEYVFHSSSDALRWAKMIGRAGCEIRQVYSLMPFRWHMSCGTLSQIVLADHMCEVFPNHRFEPLPHRVWLAGEGE